MSELIFGIILFSVIVVISNEIEKEEKEVYNKYNRIYKYN